MPYAPPSHRVQGIAAGGGLGAATAAITGSFSGPVFPLGALFGGLTGGAIGSYLDRTQTFSQRLRQDNIQIIELGDKITVLLPTDKFFLRGTSQINPHYLSVLDEVADYIRDFDKITIKISGYSDNIGSSQRNLALTQTQSQHIMQDLLKRGVNARLIHAIGYGECHPIASNQWPSGRRKNRRIEIALERIPSIPV